MIRIANEQDSQNILEYVSRDCARNYFILMSLIKDESTYQAIYIEESPDIKALLFHRASGNLQFVAYNEYDTKGFIELIKSMDFKYLISPHFFTKLLEPCLKVMKKGAIIAECSNDSFNPSPIHSLATNLTVDDLESVEILYSKVFSGYPKTPYMKRKLEEHRGTGYQVTTNSLVSVAQSEFGYVIVGVATDPNHQKKGYATECLVPLIREVLNTYPKAYLQYDNLDAGKIYERLGFKPVDQVMHYGRK